MPASPIDLLARTAGGLLSSGTNALGALRERTKPLHPTGVLRHATITRFGGAARTGVPWLDESGRDPALVRLSRGLGLPRPLPDVDGLAIRIDRDGAAADLLLATTGLGRLTRFVLLPTGTDSGHSLTTLLPYRSARGSLVIGARPETGQRLTLLWARPFGPWVPFGVLELGEPLGDDTRVSFDPVLNPLPGLAHPRWVKQLREPAYWAARRRTHRHVQGSVAPPGPRA